VSGANGFIGHHLVKRLLGLKAPVRALIQEDTTEPAWGREVDVVRTDVRNPDALRAAVSGVELVYHLAGKVHDLRHTDDSHEQEMITLGGTKNIFDAGMEMGVKRFIFLSSLHVYGRNSDVLNDETAACHPVSAYGQAKLAAEQYILKRGKKSGIHVSCLRPGAVYGPGCKGYLLRMIRFIDIGLFPPPPSVANRRSLAHVSNLVEATLLAASNPAANGQCYNVTDGRPYSTREIYEFICQSLGKHIPRWQTPVTALRFLARVGDVIEYTSGRRFLFDSDAFEKLTGSAWHSSETITRELGYRPTVSFEDALPELIAWYRKSQA